MKNIVSSASQYWQLLRLDATGKPRRQLLPSAQSYFQQQFSNGEDLLEPSDARVQRQLWAEWRSRTTDPPSAPELCLRCYISHQIQQACWQLAQQFGSRNGFEVGELLPYVLEDEGRSRPGRTYQPFGVQVLQTFEPSKGSLAAWTIHHVKQHSEIKQFLLQHGVYLISDWALLNDTNAPQIRRILAQMYQLTPLEIEQSCGMLESFHRVYREERRQQRLTGGKQPCQPPTPDQLRRMVADLQAQGQRVPTPEGLLAQLGAIASQVRRYRIAVRGGFVSTVSLDQPDAPPIADRPISEPEDAGINEFLSFYQDQFLQCLDVAVAQAVRDRVSELQRKKSAPDALFLDALHRFHCQGQPMGEIAHHIGYGYQSKVTRLLRLNELRTQIRQIALAQLRHQVLDRAKLYVDRDRLQSLDQRVDQILDEQLAGVMEEASAESRVPTNDQPQKSLLARRICQYLDTLATSQ